MMTLLAVLTFLALTGLSLWMLVKVAKPVVTEWNRSTAILYALLLVGFACVFMRPHQDTFIGLDTSAYRNMVRGFEAGRGFHDVDSALLKLPEDARPWTLLSASHQVRDTRDRSFEIEDLDTGETAPFFYPVLPLAMWGMQILLPAAGADYFVPLLGLLFVAGLLAVCLHEGRARGALIAVAMLVGTPVIVWQMRGAHVEAVSAVYLGFVGLRAFREKRIVADLLNGLAIGAALLLHPVMVLPGAVLLMAASIDEENDVRSIMKLVIGGLAGGVLLLLLTEYVSAPYGGIGIRDTMIRLKFSATHRLAVLGAGLVLLAFLVGVVCRSRISGWLHAEPRNRISFFLLLAVWIAPVTCSLFFPVSGDVEWIRRGLYDLYTGLQPWMSVVLVLGLLVTARRGQAGGVWVLIAVFSTLPMFLYLKGAEPMGYWSLRRVVVPYVMLISVLAPQVTRYISSLRSRGLQITLTMVVFIIGGVNVLLWPDPYVVRNEQGSKAFVKALDQRLDGAAVFFEQFNDSLPFSVTMRQPVYGVSDEGLEGMALLAPALSSRAGEGPTFWVTPYSNPGMEEGVVLEQRGIASRSLPRIRAKWTFPVVTDEISDRLYILEVIPVSSRKNPVMNKAFDGGLLGLRGDWGRLAKGLNAASKEVTGMWSRQNSSIIGPAASAGQIVRIRVSASSGRENVDQVLQITPPWGGDPLSLSFGTTASVQTGEWRVPEELSIESGAGRYVLTSPTPYTPSLEGIRGYRNDLGVLVYTIRIEALE